MSDKHTQGRLVVRGGYSIYADDGKTPVADTCLTNSVPGNDEANARRLVACWNACEGLPTAWIEGGAADILEHAKSLKSQRDVRIFRDGTTDKGRTMWCAVMPDFINLQESPAGFDGNPMVAVSKLRAAIAKAEAK